MQKFHESEKVREKKKALRDQKHKILNLEVELSNMNNDATKIDNFIKGRTPKHNVFKIYR
jgi:hypothetical protein